MKEEPILIIGAGAAGLLAARELLRAGKQVVVLEALPLPGGRMQTMTAASFDVPLETGAEFVHSQAPLTLKLLREYGLKKVSISGNILRLEHRDMEKSDFIEDQHKQLEHSLRSLKEDMSVDQFIQEYLPAPEYAALASQVRKFVQGYDLADTSRASAFSFRDEWLGEGRQYRVKGGYQKLVDALFGDCKKLDCVFHFNQEVRAIHWGRNHVEVKTEQETYTGSQVLITLPVALLGDEENILFSPALPSVHAAAREIGYGSVIKIFMQFNAPFWKEPEMIKRFGRKMKHAGFFFADTDVPTWWTQYPEDSALLTGWLGGALALRLRGSGDREILRRAFLSLSAMFKERTELISDRLVAWKIVDWHTNPYTRGAYAYKAVHTNDALEILRRPIDDTIFFAGEALDEESIGTVESAFSSATKTVIKMLAAISS